MQIIAKRYQVVSSLGQGASGTVYLAEDRARGGRLVALKLLEAKTAGDWLRVREEFRAMARLRHPNTLEVFDLGDCGEFEARQPFLAMEYVPGCDLSEMIASGPLPLEQVYRILIAVLQALGFIHSRLYVHRDIKAQNIRIREDGTVKLMDFGFMCQLGLLARGGVITGSLGYLPPEVVRGGTINGGSDLYSLGCLAFEMLTGSVPFVGGVREVARAHVNLPPPPLDLLRPDAPMALVKLLSRLLAKDQALRYQSAGQVIEDLAELAGLHVVLENLEQKKSYLTSGSLIGREKEMARLEGALASLQTEKRGQAIFLGAPAGVGKSRLAHEFVLHAKINEVPVLAGTCLERGMEPYEPLIQALKPMIALSTDAELAVAAPLLGAMFPDMQEKTRPAGPGGEAAIEKMRVFDALAAWLGSVSARVPLLIFMDDLQWGDPNTIEALNHCQRVLIDRPVFFLVTFRSDEVPPGSALWYSIEEGLTRYMKLEPFDLDRVQLLLHAMLGELSVTPDVLRFLNDATAGNAFFLTEILRFLIEESVLVRREGIWHFPNDVSSLSLPTTVEATILRRLGQLSAPAHQIAHVGAVIGRYQTPEMLLSLSGLEPEALFTGLDELIERQFIVKEEHQYLFPHERVREALYAEMPEAARTETHQRCGEYLERLHAERQDAVSSELAYHFGHGLDRRKAYEYLRLAGDKARANGVSARALAYWSQAAETLSTIDYPHKASLLADLWFEIGSSGVENAPQLAINALEQLIPELESWGNPERYSRLLKGLIAGLERLPGRVKAPVLAWMQVPMPYRHYQRSGWRRLVPPFVPAWLPRLIESYVFLGAAYGFAGQPSQGLARAQRGLDLMPFLESPLAASIYIVRCCNFLPAGWVDRALEDAKRAYDLLVDRDLDGQTAALAARVGSGGFQNSPCFQGYRFDQSKEDYGIWATEQIVMGHGFINSVTYPRLIWYAWTGRHEEAAALAEEMSENSRKIGAPPHKWVLYVRPYLLGQCGDYAEALRLVRIALSHPDLAGDEAVRQYTRILQGHLHLALGESEAARTIFKEAEVQARAGARDLALIQALLGRAMEALRRDALGDAGRLAEEARLLAAVGDARNPLFEAIALRLLGDVARERGQVQAAGAFYQRALTIVVRPEQDNPLEQGHLYQALARLAIAIDDREAAARSVGLACEQYRLIRNRHLIQEAEGLFEGIKALPLHPRKVRSPSGRFPLGALDRDGRPRFV